MVAILTRGVAALLLAVGGGACLLFGFRLLLRERTAPTETKFDMSFAGNDVSFSAGAAGTGVVMASVIWVFGSVTALPSFTDNKGVIEVAAAVPFEAGSSELTVVQTAVLDKLIPAIRNNDEPVIVEAAYHAGINHAELASNQGVAVSNYLVQMGIQPARIQLLAVGESTPHSGATDGLPQSVVIRNEGKSRQSDKAN